MVSNLSCSILLATLGKKKTTFLAAEINWRLYRKYEAMCDNAIYYTPFSPSGCYSRYRL